MSEQPLVLDPDERAELERLRAEVQRLRAPRARPAGRTVLAGAVIVVGCLLAPVALTSVWLHNQVADTDRFVTTVSPLVQDAAVQTALTDRVTDTVFTYVDVRGLADDAVEALADQGLPPLLVDRLRGLTGPLANSVRDFVRDRVAELVATEQFARAWDRVVRVAHEQVNGVLSGTNSAIAAQGDRMVLDLAPFIDVAKRQLVAAGLTAADAVPEVHPTIAIAAADRLVRARAAYVTLDRLATWLPWVVLALFTLGVYLAPDHRRAVVWCGVGFAASMLALAVALVIVRAALVDGVPARSATATAAAYDIVVRFLRDGLRMLFVLGVVVALGAFLAGPSVTAVRVRGGVVRGVTWLRGRAGLRSGPVGTWVHTHRAALRATAVVLAVLVFVFLDRPSGLTVLLIGLLLAVCLAVIQFLDQPTSA